MSEWRYNRNGRPSDPVDQPTLEGLLKAGSLPPDTLVWREGMPDWAKANALPEFAGAFTAPPSAVTTAIVSVPAGATMPPPSPASESAPQEPAPPPPTPEPEPKVSAPPPPAGLPPAGLPPAAASITSEQADIDQNRVFAVLAYIGLLFLVPLLAAPKSRFARYHTNQGIVLFLASFAAYGVVVFAMIATAVIPFLGCLSAPLMFAVPVASFVFMVLGVINAASGQFKPLPLIGHYELMKPEPNP